MPQELSEPSHECRDLLARLSQYVDGELPPEECQLIEKHVADCQPCMALLDTLRRTLRLCRSLDAPEVSDSLTADLKKRLLLAFQQSSRPAEPGHQRP
jgi:anti-sigma factor RsiW